MQTYFGQIRHFNVFYNARYLPFKTNNACAKFGGGGGQIRCIMGNVEMACRFN